MKRGKEQLYDFWNRASCGEHLYLPSDDLHGYQAQSEVRYHLEPFILDFVDFPSTRQQRVLEIGVGLGADHQKFAEAGAELYGIDLTERAVTHTRQRLEAYGALKSNLSVGDAEKLEFPCAYFDLVYSWGVLHHTPDTAKAIKEIHRVLKPGGIAKIMIYHKWSLVGLMLWTRYALLGLKPWRTLRRIYASHLESPGTKAYSVGEARRLFVEFKEVKLRTVLSHGDLLTSDAGQQHQGRLLNIARRMWPRGLIRRFLPRAGLFMLIEARK